MDNVFTFDVSIIQWNLSLRSPVYSGHLPIAANSAVPK